MTQKEAAMDNWWIALIIALLITWALLPTGNRELEMDRTAVSFGAREP